MKFQCLTFLLLLFVGLPPRAQAQISPKVPAYRVYPNPSHDGNFEISFLSHQQHDKVMIVVRNLVGKPVFHKRIDWRPVITQGISIGRLPKGIYLIEIKAGEEKFIRKVSYL